MSGTETTDIVPLLKRLEIIKNVIAIQDGDDIEYQTGKLKKILETASENQLTLEIDVLVKHIDNKAYGDAMRLLNDLLQKYNTITKWQDPEVQGLQTEVRSLTATISNLESELSDIEKLIHEFEVKHSEALGGLILKILDIKKKIAAEKAKERPFDDAAKQDYENAKEEEQQYKGEYEATKKTPMHLLTEAQEQELKSLFRKISKLTHPDCVDKKFEKEAGNLFMKAKEAKNNNDLEALREIYAYLITGTPFKQKDESLNEKQVLKQEVQNLRSLILKLQEKIAQIKAAETYQIIAAIKDWNTYFSETKEKLSRELERLEREIIAL